MLLSGTHTRWTCWQGWQTSQVRTVAVAAKRKQQQKKQRKPKDMQKRIFLDIDEDEEWDGGEAPPRLTPRVPVAPSPSAKSGERSPRPEDIYAVFPQQPAVTKMGGGGADGKWSWGEDGSGSDEPPVPQWNPRTGFMKTRAQVEVEERAAAAAAASASLSPSSGSTLARITGAGSPSGGSGGAPAAPVPGITSPSAAVGAGARPSAQGAAAAPLAEVSKGRVLGTCVGTTIALGVLAAVIRTYAERSAASVLGTDPELLERLLRLPAGLESATEAGAMLAAAGAVTATRLLLLQRWGALAEATDRANRQVLSPLGWADVALVSLLTGTSEEFLFRGALIPASFPDWRGALLSAALFGSLHNNGGRNAAFVVWAGAVGALYGAAFLFTENIWVAAGAHCIANFASAAVWINANGGIGNLGSSAGGGSGSGGALK